MIQDDPNKFNNKLKNKKKDVIIADISTVQEKIKPQESEKRIENNVSDNIKQNLNNPDVNSEKKYQSRSNDENTFDGAGNINTKMKEIDSNEITINCINKITLNIQFLLSLSDKVDDKLLNICSSYLSPEQFQSILEERDCRGLCGNMMCDRSLLEKNSYGKKYIYQTNTKQFTKENLSELFCDLSCFQKFKDVFAIAKKFDYFRLLHIDTIILFCILPQYYHDNLYLDEIKLNADRIIKSQRNKENLKEIQDKIKTKYDKYFLAEEKIIEGKSNKAESEVVISDMFENSN